MPNYNKNIQQSILSDFDDFARRIRIKKHFAVNPSKSTDFALQITHKQSIWNDYNLYDTTEQYIKQARLKVLVSLYDKRFKHKRNPLWITNSLKELKTLAQNDIIIKNADKNMGVTIQNRLVYERDCLEQLNDTNIYTLINKSDVDFNSLFSEIESLLNKYHQLYTGYGIFRTLTKIAKYMLQMNHIKALPLIRFARFYLIYKVHKPKVVGRPICSNINTISYFVSKYIDRQLQTAMKVASSYVDSSQSIILLLNKYKIHNNYKDSLIIVCADVVNLYPNIPIILGVQYMRDRLYDLYKRNKTLFNNTAEIDFLCDLTKWTLEHNFIEFGNTYYKQVRGTAMGTPVAVVFANLFLQQIETLVFKQLKDEFPLLFKRYIDDILALFKCMTHARKFIDIYNNIVDTIKITSTESHDFGVFLDLYIYVGPSFVDNKLDVKLYQKPQNKYLYLPSFSFHNKPIFKSFISAEINRISVNCSSQTDFIENKNLFYQRLLARDYLPLFLDPIFNEPRNRQTLLQNIQNKHENKLNKTQQLSKTRPLIFKTTYNQEVKQLKIKQCLQLTNAMKNDPHIETIFNNMDPIICYKSNKKIGQILTSSNYKHDISTHPNSAAI
jgi:hypothetical protein